MGTASQEFDRELFTRKLSELSHEMQIKSVASGRRAGTGGSFLLNIVNGQLALLRDEWLTGVDRIAREVWQIQGEAVTPEFVREILMLEAMTLIGAREGTIKSIVAGAAQRTHLEDPHAAQHHLAMELGRLKADVSNRYEIEVRELKYRNAPTEDLPRQAQPPTSQPVDQRENLLAAILKKKSRIADIERLLNKYPLEIQRLEKGEVKRYPTRPPTRLEEERQHLLIAVTELERDELLQQSSGLQAQLTNAGELVRMVTNAPKPMTSVRGWPSSRPKPTQIPRDCPNYYPNDLIPQTQVIIAEAVRKFPEQMQTLELCKHVTSKMTPLFQGAVKAGTMRADAALSNSGMGGLLHSLLVYNCDNENERFRLEQEVRKSDEWLNLAKEVADAQCGSSESKHSTPKSRLKATVSSPFAAKRMEAFLESKAIGQTDFANSVGTTDRTLRAFRKTGKVRRDIFDAIAMKMNITKAELMKPE